MHDILTVRELVDTSFTFMDISARKLNITDNECVERFRRTGYGASMRSTESSAFYDLPPTRATRDPRRAA